jgi:hypothetical protein
MNDDASLVVLGVFVFLVGVYAGCLLMMWAASSGEREATRQRLRDAERRAFGDRVPTRKRGG